jgi:hypothetical protein
VGGGDWLQCEASADGGSGPGRAEGVAWTRLCRPPAGRRRPRATEARGTPPASTPLTRGFEGAKPGGLFQAGGTGQEQPPRVLLLKNLCAASVHIVSPDLGAPSVHIDFFWKEAPRPTPRAGRRAAGGLTHLRLALCSARVTTPLSTPPRPRNGQGDAPRSFPGRRALERPLLKSVACSADGRCPATRGLVFPICSAALTPRRAIGRPPRHPPPAPALPPPAPRDFR